MCSWLKSVNKLDRFNVVCDLATLPEYQPALPVKGLKLRNYVCCGGDQTRCENPNLLQAEMELEHERRRFGLEEEVPEHLIGLNCTLGEAGAYEGFYKGESK